MKKIFVLLFLVVFTLGCEMGTSGGKDGDGSVGNNDENSDGVEEISFSELNDSILNVRKDKELNPNGYVNFMFKEGRGECIDLGVPDGLNYVYDVNLEYHVIRSADRKYFDQFVSLDFLGNLRFDSVPIGDEQAVDCTLQSIVGEDVAEMSCKLDGVEHCKARYKLFALK